MFGFMLTVVVVGSVIIGHLTGRDIENNRIYEQCMKNNSELSVTKATELCKEIVK